LRKTYLSGWYFRVKQRRGAKKALIALARRILTVIYSILKDKDSSYYENAFLATQEKLNNRRFSRMIKELRQNGFSVTPVQPS